MNSLLLADRSLDLDNTLYTGIKSYFFFLIKHKNDVFFRMVQTVGIPLTHTDRCYLYAYEPEWPTYTISWGNFKSFPSSYIKFTSTFNKATRKNTSLSKTCLYLVRSRISVFWEKKDLFGFILPLISSHNEVVWTLISGEGIMLWRLCQFKPV